MQIQYCSDLHLEFKINSLFLKEHPLIPSADILILAGDITYLRDNFYTHSFFDYVSKHWKVAYWIPGNHEYYCGIDILLYDYSKPFPIRKNVFLVNNISLVIDKVKFIFSTLWSVIDLQYSRLIENNVSDFHCIVYDDNKLSSKTFNQLHKQSFNFIKQELQTHNSDKTVVVTHHLPSAQCNHLNFVGSKINSAFCVDLTDYIQSCNADIWIYGHSHRNMPQITIGKTQLITNQLGYVEHEEHADFKLDAMLEI